MYNWQYKKWPQFEYDLRLLEPQLMGFMMKTGQINGALLALPQEVGLDAVVQLLVSEAMKTSEIEGEVISRKDVMSSIKKNLGLQHSKIVGNRYTIGLSEMLVDVRHTFNEQLTEKKLFHWHKLLMKNNKNVNAGQWRTHNEPMQVVSGSISKPTVHFEAPPSKTVPKEMARFIKWFNETSNDSTFHPMVRAAIVHLYFESIHPFEDGNGRIGRALLEKALSQGTGSPIVISISKSIEAQRSEYYEQLQRAQKTLQITEWIHWFVLMVLAAQDDAEKTVHFTIKKVRFFDKFNNLLNDRQQKVLNRMFVEFPQEFKGGMNATKYMSIVKSSKATATRDLQSLVEMGAFVPVGAGRSTRYNIAEL